MAVPVSSPSFSAPVADDAGSVVTLVSLPRRAFAEFVGTAFLVAAVIGSGIAASRLSPGDPGLQLFENAVATGAALVAIILAVGPVSGGHLNPVITLLDRTFGGMRTPEALSYIGAQVAGGVAGACIANLMFGLPAIDVATTSRTGGGVWLSEVVATLGLCLVVFGVVRSGRRGVAPFAVGSYIAAAYFFTASTSFANPAVTLARTLSDTFTGIRPASAVVFVGFQLVGAVAAGLVIVLLYPQRTDVAIDLVEPKLEPSTEPTDQPVVRVGGSAALHPRRERT